METRTVKGIKAKDITGVTSKGTTVSIKYKIKELHQKLNKIMKRKRIQKHTQQRIKNLEEKKELEEISQTDAQNIYDLLNNLLNKEKETEEKKILKKELSDIEIIKKTLDKEILKEIPDEEKLIEELLKNDLFKDLPDDDLFKDETDGTKKKRKSKKRKSKKRKSKSRKHKRN